MFCTSPRSPVEGEIRGTLVHFSEFLCLSWWFHDVSTSCDYKPDVELSRRIHYNYPFPTALARTNAPLCGVCELS